MYGFCADRDLETAGAGGLAANTVPLSSSERVVGGMGLNSETSQVRVHNEAGKEVKVPTNDGLYKPPHFEVVQSWRRDPITYPDPRTFRLKFAKPLVDVFMIEVGEINVPNVAATPPPNREFLLLNGLMRQKSAGSGGGYTFTPQREIDQTRSLHTMLTHNANDPGVDRSAVAWDATRYFEIDNYALARFNYDPTEPHQFHDREGWNRRTWFAHPIRRLEGLEFTLGDVHGDLYDMPTDENWSATLQIYSKA